MEDIKKKEVTKKEDKKKEIIKNHGLIKILKKLVSTKKKLMKMFLAGDSAEKIIKK
jgi:hypothetical protein